MACTWQGPLRTCQGLLKVSSCCKGGFQSLLSPKRSCFGNLAPLEKTQPGTGRAAPQRIYNHLLGSRLLWGERLLRAESRRGAQVGVPIVIFPEGQQIKKKSLFQKIRHPPTALPGSPRGSLNKNHQPSDINPAGDECRHPAATTPL